MMRRPVWIVPGVLASAFAVLFAAGVVFWMVRGQYVNAIQNVGNMAICAAAAVACWSLGRDDVSPRPRVDKTGTTFLPDPGLDIPLQVIVFALILEFVWTGSPTMFGDPSRTDGWVMAACVTVLLAALLVSRNRRWGAGTYLRMTPIGVDLGYLRRRSCDWSQIHEVTGVPPGRRAWVRARRTHNVVVVVSETIALQLPTVTFTRNGAALRDLVEFYWRHPEARGELTDGSASRRLAATSDLSR